MQFLDDGTVIDSRPLSTLSGQTITVDGTAAQSETLFVNYGAAGFFDTNVLWHGGTGGTDALRVTGGTFTTVIHNFTNAGPGHSGNIAYNTGALNSTLTYDGLEPIDMSGSTIADLTFNLPGTASTAVLGDDGTTPNGISQISSSNGTFETTNFSNPTGSLTINRGTATDTLTVNALPDFNASLTLGSAGNPFSALTFAGAVTLAANKNLTANASGTISVSTANSDLATSGTGTISLTTARDTLRRAARASLRRMAL